MLRKVTNAGVSVQDKLTEWLYGYEGAVNDLLCLTSRWILTQLITYRGFLRIVMVE